MAEIIAAGRLRKSPYYDSTIAEGAESLLIHNGMLIPRGYCDREAEYWRLMKGASMRGVAVQRQVQLKGGRMQPGWRRSSARETSRTSA